MSRFRARCIDCDGAVRVFLGRTIDEVRAERCPRCGRHLTVIGHDEQPPATRTRPPTCETIGLSREARGRVDRISRALVLSALEEQE